MFLGLRTLAMAASIILLCMIMPVQRSAAQAIDCKLYPLECPPDGAPETFNPSFNFKIEIAKPVKAPKISKPVIKQKSKTVQKPVPKKAQTPKPETLRPQQSTPKPKHVRKTKFISPKVVNSWDGLPAIPAIRLNSPDMIDIPNQYMAVLDLQALANANINLQTISNDGLAQQLGIGTSQLRSIQRRFVGSVVLNLTPQQAQTLQSNPLLVFLEADTQIKAATKKKAKVLPLSWGLDRLDSPFLPLDGKFNRKDGDYAARVYLFDTRVVSSRDEFGDRITASQDFLRNKEESGSDCRSHGTEMASLIAGSTTGAAPRTELVSLIVLPCDSQKTGQASSLVEAAEWLLVREADHGDEKPAIANMSLSGKFSRTLNHVVNVLSKNNVAVIAAAGNENNNACRYSPGSAPEAITVAASGPDDSVWSQSNTGPCIDVYAPGSLLTVLTVTDGNSRKTTYAAIDGTSGATALVTGILARSMLKQGQTETHLWIKQAGVPGKLWHKDRLDIMLIQNNDDWKNRCRTTANLQLWQEPLASDAGPQIAENALISVIERRGRWQLISTDNDSAGWIIPRDGELVALDGGACN